MMDKRLLALAGKEKQTIFACVAIQWTALCANICIIFALANLLGQLQIGAVTNGVWLLLFAAGIGVPLRFACGILSGRASEQVSARIKRLLRAKIYQKLLRLGLSYQKHISTAEAVQLTGEGVEQLEVYFGRYLPQFFYSMLAPLTLFAVLSFISLKAAVILLICVPIIPMAIVFVQKFAKRLFKKYWGEYTTLGDNFLENVQGLTTLKIYQADERRHAEMNAQTERFRKITMRVLTMQLNSISVMDIVAYGGAALGAVAAPAGEISLPDCVIIVLLSAEFFLPMRLLGSYFHVAMNGMAAGGKLFKLLDIPEKAKKELGVTGTELRIRELSFSYDETREVLRGVSMDIPAGGFTAIAGESGSGKSTLAALLTGTLTGYKGELTLGGQPLCEIDEAALLRHVTYIGHQSYLFAGTVRENLQTAKPNATDIEMANALQQAKLWDFLQDTQGLDTQQIGRASCRERV